MFDDDYNRRTVLRAATGTAIASTGLVALSGTVSAHFPAELDIDIKPDSEKNAINSRSNGRVSVAVLQTETFDPTSEAVQYRFGATDIVANGGGAEPVHQHVRDVDGDGFDDLVLQFQLSDAEFDGDEKEAELRWERDESGEHGLSGRAPVTFVGRN